MSSDAPPVSIGLPVFNGERYLEYAVDSLLTQTFTDFELIICDNASTDGTELLCRKYEARDSRVRYHRFHENAGAAANYNRCVALARGRYFKWAAHDDVCEPTFLARAVQAYEQLPDSVVLVYPRTRFIGPDGTTLGDDPNSLETRDVSPRRRLAHVIRRVNRGNAVFGLIRADALRQTRLIDCFTASDYVLLVELALLGELVELPDPLLLRRLHPETSRNANRSRAEVAAWFDPRQASRWQVPTKVRLLAEYTRSVHRLPLTWREKSGCYLTVPTTFLARRARVIAGRHKRALLARLRSSSESPFPTASPGKDGVA